jgi:tellurite methyltransferase
MIDDRPSPFVMEWIVALAASVPAPRRALDLAMGRGRHAVALAREGFRTFGVDVRFDAVRDAVLAAAAARVSVRGWCADIVAYPLPPAHFGLMLVSRYLQRDLFPAIREAVTPGGVVVYETFTTAQRALGTGPRSPDHLLRPGELRQAFEQFEVLFYVEVTAPEAVARLVARRRN